MKLLTTPKTVKTKPVVPRRQRDDNGLPLPTQFEIDEGAALLALHASPNDDQSLAAYQSAWNALYGHQGRDIAVLRCGRCLTRKWGRLRQDRCSVCGSKRGIYDIDNE